MAGFEPTASPMKAEKTLSITPPKPPNNKTSLKKLHNLLTVIKSRTLSTLQHPAAGGALAVSPRAWHRVNLCSTADSALWRVGSGRDDTEIDTKGGVIANDIPSKVPFIVILLHCDKYFD